MTAQQAKMPKKRKRSEVEERKDSETKDDGIDAEETDDESPEKKPKTDTEEPFLIEKFINVLDKGGDLLEELRKFVGAADSFASGESTVDAVKQFLDGTNANFQGVMSLLDGVKPGAVMHTAVYNVLERLFSRLPEDFQQHVNTALVSAQQMLQKHSRLLHQSLNRTANYSHVRATMRLLTSIVTLGPEGARYVTSVINFETVDLTPWFNTRSRKDPEDVRTSTIFFLMSILVVGSNSVARQVLQAKGLINSIFPGLLYDRAPFIRSFLSTFQSKVVESLSFTKTLKVKMLNDKSLKYVVQLLTWKGPKPWTLSGKWNKYKAQRETDKEDPEAVLEASKEDVEVVRSTAFNFLISVCCSSKYGVLFRDPRLGQSRQNTNFVITSTLLTMEHPYNHDLCSSFVVKVMKAAPDQIGHYLHGWQPILMYSTAGTAQKLIDLFTRVVEVQDLNATLWATNEKVPERICRLVVYFALLRLVHGVGEAQSIQNESKAFPLQLSYLRFVAASLQLVKAACDHIRGPQCPVSVGLKGKLLRLIRQDVWKNVPPTTSLVARYKEAVQMASPQGKGEPPKKKKAAFHSDCSAYCATILDVLDLYRGFSQDSDDHYNWKMLSELAGIKTGALDSPAEGLCLQLRAIGLILECCPNSEALMTSEKKDTSTLSHLLHLFARCKGPVIGKSAASLISKLLCNLSVLDGYGSEVDLWMEQFRRGHHVGLIRLLLEAVRLIISDSDRLNSEVMQYVKEHDTAGPGGKESAGRDLWTLLKQDAAAAKESEDLESFEAGTYFSPLVPAMLETLKDFPDDMFKKYVYSVIRSILHHQQRPHVFVAFLRKHALRLSKPLLAYAAIWSTPDLPKLKPIKEELGEQFYFEAEKRLEHLFFNLLFYPGEKKLDSEDKSFETLLSDVSKCSSFDCTSLFYQTMFYTRKLFVNGDVSVGVADMLQVLKAVFERTIELGPQKEEASALLNVMLRDELTLSYYLHGDKESDVFSAALKYTNFLLDTIHRVLENNPSVPPSLQASLRVLKDRSVAIMAGGVPPKGLDTERLLQAFGSELTEADMLALLEAATRVTSKKYRKSLGALLSSWLSCACREEGREEDVPLLSAAVVQSMLAIILECSDKTALLAAFLRFLELRPVYVFALGSEEVRRLLEDQCSAGIDVVTFLVRHNVQHRRQLQQLIPLSFKPVVSHLSPASVAGFLRALTLGLSSATTGGPHKRLLAWLTKTFLVLPKRMCALEEGVSPQVVHDMTACLESLVKLGQLGNDNVAKLVDILADTAERQLQLALLNALCHSMTEELLDSAVCDSCLHTLLQCITNLVAGNEEPPEHVLRQLQEAVATAEAVDEKVFARVVRQDGLWPQFIKSNLKAGFQSQTFGKTSFELLSVICRKVYSAESVGDINPALCRVYLMMFGHSRFLPLMLDTDPKSQDQRDQRILYLMYLYEKNGVDLCSFKPFLWGPSAVSFYSLHKKASVTLLKQPKSEEVLNLINEDKMAATVSRFPLELELDVVPVESVADGRLYDPRFMLPLLYTLLSPVPEIPCTSEAAEFSCAPLPQHSLQCAVHQQEACLCYVMLCRAALCIVTVISISYAFWLAVLEALRNAATVTCPHVPCLVTGYLVSAIEVISNPGHYMFSAVMTFLLAKPVLDIDNVPDFYKMFYNYRVEHHMKRDWHLEVMADYMRCGVDFHISKKRYIFHILLTFFMSPLCQKSTKALILKVLIAAVKIPKAARILCREQGLLMWLPAALERYSIERPRCVLCMRAQSELSTNQPIHNIVNIWAKFGMACGQFILWSPFCVCNWSLSACTCENKALSVFLRNAEEEGVPELLLEVVHHVWKSSFVKTLRVKDLQAARGRKVNKASRGAPEPAEEDESEDEDREEGGGGKGGEDEAASILAKRESLRYYEYFPYEFLLTLFNIRQHVR
ncbi:hypothetical protein HPB48_008246 [Haemaphysalis longicornis]|uniref:Nucleolar pre-ribosomal-associated protein 1 n=1 Tax=Haemaphysalis longicornis TaxID=44386 RepID=A0A9J6H1W3_HAELO|nr:hypothetical protein HPB48_008246 [Haemaphysalis longicornis]